MAYAAGSSFPCMAGNLGKIAQGGLELEDLALAWSESSRMLGVRAPAGSGLVRGPFYCGLGRGTHAGGAVKRSTIHWRKAGRSFHAVATRTGLPLGSMRVKPSSVTRSGRVSISQNSSETAR